MGVEDAKAEGTARGDGGRVVRGGRAVRVGRALAGAGCAGGRSAVGLRGVREGANGALAAFARGAASPDATCGGARTDGGHDVRVDARRGHAATPVSAGAGAEERIAAKGAVAALGWYAHLPHTFVSLGRRCAGAPGLCAGHQPLGRGGRGAHRGLGRCGGDARAGDLGHRGGRGGALQLRRPGGGQRGQGAHRLDGRGGGAVALDAGQCAGA